MNSNRLKIDMERSEILEGGYLLWLDDVYFGFYHTLDMLHKAILSQTEQRFKQKDMEGQI